MSVTFEQVKALLDEAQANKLAFFAKDRKCDENAAMSILVRTEMFSALRLLLSFQSVPDNNDHHIETCEQSAEILSESCLDNSFAQLLHEIACAVEASGSAQYVQELLSDPLINCIDCCTRHGS